MTALFFGIGFGLVTGIRWWAGYAPILDWLVIVTVAALIMAPLGFLAAIGAFDYWTYYALGFPSRAEDHSGHCGQSWRSLACSSSTPRRTTGSSRCTPP